MRKKEGENLTAPKARNARKKEGMRERKKNTELKNKRRRRQMKRKRRD